MHLVDRALHSAGLKISMCQLTNTQQVSGARRHGYGVITLLTAHAHVPARMLAARTP